MSTKKVRPVGAVTLGIALVLEIPGGHKVNNATASYNDTISNKISLKYWSKSKWYRTYSKILDRILIL